MAIKITFLGAGSSVFVRNVLGDCIIHPELEDLTFALYDKGFPQNQDAMILFIKLDGEIAVGICTDFQSKLGSVFAQRKCESIHKRFPPKKHRTPAKIQIAGA